MLDDDTMTSCTGITLETFFYSPLPRIDSILDLTTHAVSSAVRASKYRFAQNFNPLIPC